MTSEEINNNHALYWSPTCELRVLKYKFSRKLPLLQQRYISNIGTYEWRDVKIVNE
jgi:hypothetical protein